MCRASCLYDSRNAASVRHLPCEVWVRISDSLGRIGALLQIFEEWDGWGRSAKR
jgi:hypothetical protein